MNKFIKHPLVLVTVFIWIGFVCSISFMEAWLKFRAAHVTLPVGLSIGRLIFDALNKVEWTFATLVIAHLALRKNKVAFPKMIFFCVPIIALILQTFFLLPALNERAEMILQGQAVLPSFVHFYYLSIEFVKVTCLFIFGVSTFSFYEIRESA